MNKQTFLFILASINNALSETEENDGMVAVFLNNGNKVVLHSSTITAQPDLMVAQTDRDTFSYIPYQNISYITF